MNAKVTTYWMFGQPIVQTMPEDEVANYLKTAKEAGTMKGYIVDAVPLDEENRPRAPIAADAVTTIFPVEIGGKIHAAYVMDYRTDKFATMCGKQVQDPSTVEHRVAQVTCRPCTRNMR